MKRITVTISRFDPVSDQEPRFVEYTVPVSEGARILNVLQAVHDQDPTLSFRSSCRAGQCGSCAVRVNGEPALACMTAAEDGMRIEPLDLPVIRDLTVELVPGINQIPRIHPDEHAEAPSHETIDRIRPLRDCIECLSCVSVCPAMKVTDFIGPTSMRAQMRIALDPRETGTRIREAIFDGLLAGRIDRTLFTSNANGYFSAQAVADFQASLGPLGPPKEFKHLRTWQRGGMTGRAYHAIYPDRKLRVWTYELPDGKLEQLQVQAIE